MRMRWRWLPAASLTVILAGRAAAVEVSLTVTDDAKTARKPGTVTAGVPFARGAVKDVGRLSVSVGGKALPAQFIVLARWDDGSVRWALMDTQVDVPAGGTAEVVVRDDGGNKPPAAPVKVTDGPDAVTVSTGPLEFTVRKRPFSLFRSLTVDGRDLVTSAGRGLVIYTDDKREVAAGPPETVRIEQAGPMKAIVCLKGKYPGVHNNLIGYTVRITAYAGRKFVKVHVWLENGGAHGYTTHENKPPYKPEWFAFDGMAVELGLGLGRGVKASCEEVEGSETFKVLQACKPPAPRSNWSVSSYTWKDFEYTITGADKELTKGARTDAVVALSGPGGTLTTAIRHFWQQYEKAIELDGTTLRLWLWPTEGEYPRFYATYPCPGYATQMMQPLRKPGLYNMPGAIHKGHEMILDFSGRDPTETAAELSRPLVALASAATYASTEAAPGLFTPPEIRTDDDECNAKLDAWMCMTRSAADPGHPSSIWQARRDRHTMNSAPDTGFSYGWMDFGDFAVPGSAAVSLHYDWPWVALVDAMRTGDANFMRLAGEMTRHRIDIDQQWSDRELPAYRGFQRPGYSYAHFHCERFTRGQPNVVTNWLAGVVLYYMLTGEPKALECIERNSHALRRGWEQIATTRDYSLRRTAGDMQAVARAIFSYCAMHGLTADRMWLDEALKLFHTHVVAKWKNLGPHLHERQQIRSQDYTRDDVRYCYSIQAFCLLHHLTGDKKLFELLKAGCDTEFPENYFDAPLFLADLNAYVALKTGEKNYIENAVEDWIQAFPESRCPPVYLPDNSQWSRRAAMMLRTGHLLQYYYWKNQREGR